MMRWNVGECAALLVASVLLGGCGTEGTGPVEMSVRDSADVRIVEYTDFSGARRLVTGDTPLVSLGDQGGSAAQEFFRVRGAELLSDGSLVVANGGSQEVRRFSSTGEHLGSFGSQGDGPGEFRRLGSLVGGAGDSVFVYDAGRRRITILSRALEYGREVTFQGDYRNLELGGVFPDHDLLLVDNGYPDEGETQGFQPFHGRYLVADPLGEQRDSIGRFPWYRLTITESGADMRGVRAFFNEPTAATVSGDLAWIGTRQRHEIEGRGPDGRMRTIIRWPVGDRAVGSGDIDTWKRARLADAPPEQQDAMREMLDGAAFSDVYPTHGALLGRPGGGVWIEEYRRPTTEGPPVWWAFDGDGVLEATVALPEGTRPLSVRDDRVLVLERDEFDVELVRVYELVETDGVG